MAIRETRKTVKEIRAEDKLDGQGEMVERVPVAPPSDAGRPVPPLVSREAKSRRIGVVLIPRFALISFSMIIEPLRSANLVTRQALYEWVLLSASGGDVPSNSGVMIATTALREAAASNLDMILVCAGLDPDKFHSAPVESYLRRQSRHGVLIGAVSTGSFILARAGLLDEHRCTVHWDYKAGFQESYPALKVSDELFVVDRQIATCAGGTAVLDMMLYLIAQHHDDRLSRAVSEQFIHGAARQSQDRQRNDLRYRLGTSNAAVVNAVRLMEQHLDAPLSPSVLAKRLKTSQRQLERLFQKYLGCTPSGYYQGLRMERARSLLKQTDLPITEIAVSCGFASASYFSTVYQRYFKVLPRRDRRL
jgi:transcriptional regulator GlxA family with amidase domain